MGGRNEVTGTDLGGGVKGEKLQKKSRVSSISFCFFLFGVQIFVWKRLHVNGIKKDKEVLS